MSAPVPRWPARGPLVVGIMALVLFVGGLGGWSLTTELAGAIIAPGKIAVESNRQVIQHPDGGVVQAVLARDGDRVEAGQTLLRLDDTRLASELTIVEGQLREIAARRARLVAERTGAATITFPAALLAVAETDPEVAAKLAGEKGLFQARRDAMVQQGLLLDQQNEQIASRIDGIEAQVAALTRQQALVARDLDDQRRLFASRLTPAAAVSALEREAAGVEGQIGRLRAEIAELRGQIPANEIARLQLDIARREEATSAERDLQFSGIELVERRLALTDRLSRMEVRAPVSGVIVESRIFAAQAVVQPAEPVMYIVPQDQPLVVAARVAAIDIDQVHVGQPVALRFSSFDQTRRLPAEGEVVRISADAITDEATGVMLYAVEIRLSGDALDGLNPGEALLPGMPVQAFLRTRDRTAFAYLVEPLTGFLDRTFRE